MIFFGAVILGIFKLLQMNKNNFRVMRFVQGFKLNPNELDLYKLIYESNICVMDAIAYYQEGDKEVYNRRAKIRKFRKQTNT